MGHCRFPCFYQIPIEKVWQHLHEKIKKKTWYFFKNTSMHKRPYHSFVWSLEERGTKFGKFLQQKNLEIFWWEFQEKFLQPRLSKRPNGCSWIIENSNTTIDKKLCTAQAYAPQWINMFFSWYFFISRFFWKLWICLESCDVYLTFVDSRSFLFLPFLKIWI